MRIKVLARLTAFIMALGVPMALSQAEKTPEYTFETVDEDIPGATGTFIWGINPEQRRRRCLL